MCLHLLSVTKNCFIDIKKYRCLQISEREVVRLKIDKYRTPRSDNNGGKSQNSGSTEIPSKDFSIYIYQ